MPSILVFGDEAQFADLVHAHLGRLGYRSTQGPPDPAQALLATRQVTPDAVLVDIACDYAYVEAGARIRGELDIPVLHLTGRADDERVIRARPAEPDGYVDDVGNERELRGALEIALRRRGRRTERTDARSERLKALGAITAAMAHEINNPLTWVFGNMALVMDTLRTLRDHTLPAPGHPAMPRGVSRQLEGALGSLERACEGAERIRRIIADLRDFSAPDELERRQVDVRGVLDTALRVYGNELRHRATVVRDYKDVPPVDANHTQLGQVFLNLLANASQAIPAGRAEANEIRVRVHPDTQGWVCIEIEDTGHGIPTEYLERIFDPFFTTRPIGEGRGMGLSVALGIVTDHGGEIAVRSRMGAGSTFVVRLPPAPVEQAYATLERDTDTNAEVRRGRVLIVDDEPLVLDVLGRLLGTVHDVEVFTSGREALDRVLRDGAAFDALLCDLMMPDTTGMDVYEAIAQERPDLAERIVFVTGGAFTERAMRFLQEVPNPRLEKPFEVRKLFNVLQRVIG